MGGDVSGTSGNLGKLEMSSRPGDPRRPSSTMTLLSSGNYSGALHNCTSGSAAPCFDF